MVQMLSFVNYTVSAETTQLCHCSLRAATDKMYTRDFPGSPDSVLPMQGTWLLFLVRELRSHMPQGQKKREREREGSMIMLWVKE